MINNKNDESKKSNKQFITVERKNEKLLSLPKGSIISNEDKKPKIYEKDTTAKQYIKQYRLKTISPHIENQLIKSSKIIHDTLLKDLKEMMD